MQEHIALTNAVDLQEMARLVVANTNGEFVAAFSGADMLFWKLRTVHFNPREPVDVDMEMEALDEVLTDIRELGLEQHVLVRNLTSVTWDEPPNVAWLLAAKHAHVNVVAVIDVVLHVHDETGHTVHFRADHAGIDLN